MPGRPEAMVVAVGDEVLADLRNRLRRTRWPSDLGNDDWSYGMNRACLQEFCEYWAEGRVRVLDDRRARLREVRHPLV